MLWTKATCYLIIHIALNNADSLNVRKMGIYCIFSIHVATEFFTVFLNENVVHYKKANTS